MIGALVAGITGSGGASLSSYESIATTTLSSDTTITFSSIPSTFKHLQIRLLMRRTGTDSSAVTQSIQVNNDTGSNYAEHSLEGSGSAASATGTASTNTIQAVVCPRGTSNPSTYGVAIIDILDYASTSKYKTFRCFTGSDTNGAGAIKLVSGLWMSTSALNRIDFLNTMSSGSTVALYGIKEA